MPVHGTWNRYFATDDRLLLESLLNAGLWMPGRDWPIMSLLHISYWGETVEIIFWMMGINVDGTFFAFTGGSGLVLWPEVTPFFDVEAWNSKIGPFGERLWLERTAKKRAPCLAVENHVVRRNFPRIVRFLMTDWKPEAVLSDTFYQSLNILVEGRFF